MIKNAIPTLSALAALGLIAGISFGGGKSLNVTLNGASEVPGPGDPDGTGTFKMTVNPGKGEVCYTLTFANIETATAAHIHRAPSDEAGAVVVPLELSGTNTTTDCVSVDRELARDLMKNPGDYYVNVHNTVYPSGAIRAQLDSDDEDDDKN